MKRSRSFTIQKKLSKPTKDPHQRDLQSLDKTKPKNDSRKFQTIPEAIMSHISKRSDVEIIVFYEQYRQQFFLKCKKLQEYLYKFPAMKEKYVNDDNPHFKYAMQYLMLDLYRKGVIVPQSYDNLRMDAVHQIENWILSWIQRKLLYEKAKEEEKEQVIRTCSTLMELEDYVKIIEVEELPF